MTDDSQDKNRPAITLRDGNIKATIWRNPGGMNDDGSQKPDWFSTEISRTYKDPDGNWRESHRLSGTDLLKAEKLAGEAYQQEQQFKDFDRMSVDPAVEAARDSYKAVSNGAQPQPSQDLTPTERG